MPTSNPDFDFNRLTVPERLDLIEKIWESLPDQVSPDEVPDWHLSELAIRLAEAEAKPGEGKPWREVLRQIEAES
jgi:putative addiction module component (TIGR02574 family)